LPNLLLGALLGAALSAAPPPPGIVVANMDPSVAPGNDFFSYANGGWVARAVIPADRASVSAFSRLSDISDRRSAALIEGVTKSQPAPGSDARKIADLYNAYMETAAIDRRGLAPLRARLAAIAAIRTRTDLAHVLGESLRADVDALNNTNFHTPNLFGMWVAPGFHDPAHYDAFLLQGGLELPNREYYLANSAAMRALRAQYPRQIAALLGLEGLSEPAARAARVLALEQAIAATHWSLAEDEDMQRADNPWSAADFAAKAPGLDWPAFFRAAGLGHVARFIVWQPSAFTGEAALVGSQPLQAWKDWLDYHLIEDYADVLPRAVRQQDFAFFGQQVQTTPQQRPRWQLAVAEVNSDLGDAVGKLYAQRYFPPAAQAAAQAMVANIITAFHRRLTSLTWMDPATKAEAQAKLNALYVGIGYPETWRDYSKLAIRPGDAFGNAWRAAAFEYDYQRSLLGSAVDRKQWHMEPQTVNALNLPLQVALNFPAAILQPPFFDPQAPAAVNYGGIGAVIGHEVSHTFDTEGSAFDATGRLRNWWKPADLAHFKASTARLAAQMSAYRPFPDLAVNGPQTLGEDIADVAGLAAAYAAYHASLHGQPGPSQQGFTADQQFFIAFGQDWAQKIRPAALRRQILTDEHAPARYRADSVRNADAWYAAFPVRPGQALYLAPADRIRIW